MSNNASQIAKPTAERKTGWMKTIKFFIKDDRMRMAKFISAAKLIGLSCSYLSGWKYEMFGKIASAGIFLMFLISNAKVCAIDKIYIYDLRSTLKINLDDSNQVNNAWDTCHAVATLQGLVNRSNPQLYLIYVDSQHKPGNVDEYWLDKCSRHGQWLYEVPKEEIKSLESLIETLRKFVNGVVVYDPMVPVTSNVASAVAGAEGLIAVRYDKRPGSVCDILVNKMKLPQKVSFVQDDGSSLFKADGKMQRSENIRIFSKVDNKSIRKEHKCLRQTTKADTIK